MSKIDRSVDLGQLLEKVRFLVVATVDENGQPDATPKLFLKYEEPYIYLVDYSFATTNRNLKLQPKASLAFIDVEDLDGYRLRGTIELISGGTEFGRLAKEVERKVIQLSAIRVVEAVRTGKKPKHYEIEIADKFALMKFKIEEVTFIGPRGQSYKENVRMERKDTPL
jgi:predicted pyridoxine 5'-phosphate oxidase superfamily flavin-nucleotide-binding protein